MTLEDVLLHRNVSEFLTHEAALLDKREFGAWLELFEADGVYWVPSSADQSDMQSQVSVIAEDKPLLALRVGRLSHPRAYSVEPHPRTTHLVGNISVAANDGIVEVNSKLMVEELREDKATRFSGTVTHQLRHRDDGFGIVLKRVDLIQAGGIFAPISIPF